MSQLELTPSKSKIKWDEKYSERAIKTTLIELLFYIMFLVVTTFLAFQLSGARMYYFTQIMRKLFIEKNFDDDLNFESISLLEEFWLYCENILLPVIYGTDTRIIRENKLIGLVRIRQIRIKNNSCKVHYLFAKQFKYCYAEYTGNNKDTEPLILNGSTWTYHKETLFLKNTKTYGILTSYPSGGYIQDLGYTLEENQIILEKLKSHDWIDRGTRAIIIEFTIYNGNSNLFCVMKLIIEIPPSGGLITSYMLRTVKLLRFRSALDYIILGLEIWFGVQIVYFTVVEILEIKNAKWIYFRSFWNWIDLLIITLSYTMIVYSIFSFLYIRLKIAKYVKESDNTFVSFDLITFWQLAYNNIVAIVTFLVWIKLLKFISFNQSMLQFSNTLKRCAKDLLGFSIMFIIVFVSFAQLGFMLFGTENEDFRSFKFSIFTLMRTVLGDFNYVALEQSNWVLGPIYFLAFIFLVFFVLLNMFLAIINDTYSEVKSEPVKPIYLWRTLRNLCRKNKLETTELTNDSVSKGDETEEMRKSSNVQMDEEFKQFVKYELDKMDKRLKTVEITIDGVVNNLDVLIKKLEEKQLKSQ